MEGIVKAALLQERYNLTLISSKWISCLLTTRWKEVVESAQYIALQLKKPTEIASKISFTEKAKSN